MRRAETIAPRTRITAVAALPGWVLRIVVPLTIGGAALAAGAAGPAQWAVVGVLAALLAMRPHGALLALGVAVLAAMYVLSEPAGPWQLPVLLLATHLVLVVGALADVVSWRARIEVAVLRDALGPFLAVQAAAQAGGLLAMVLQGRATAPWLVVVATIALAVVGWLLLRPLRRD